MNLAAIWEDLERVQPPRSAGKVKRRILPHAGCDIFVAIEKPQNTRMLLMLAGDNALDEVEDLPTGQGVEARIAQPGEDGEDVGIELVLTDPRSADIFTALAEDIARTVAVETDQAAAVLALTDRLRRWQRFLQLVSPEGLGYQAQLGLYAELWILRHHLLDGVGHVRAIRAWTGPSGASHDFQLGSCALEVKATTQKQHQVLRIASERQLDDAGVAYLYLFHLSLDTHLDGGASLPDLVAEVRNELAGGPAASAFEDRLLGTGYTEAQAHRYANPGYSERESNFFHVTSDFPRITEADLRRGVGDVTYSIAVAECKHFQANADIMLERARGE